MNTARKDRSLREDTVRSRYHRPRARSRWAALILAGVALWLFIFVVAPGLQSYEPIGSFHHHIRHNDIDATALFYTESPSSGEGELFLRHAISSPLGNRSRPAADLSRPAPSD